MVRCDSCLDSTHSVSQMARCRPILRTIRQHFGMRVGKIGCCRRFPLVASFPIREPLRLVTGRGKRFAMLPQFSRLGTRKPFSAKKSKKSFQPANPPANRPVSRRVPVHKAIIRGQPAIVNSRWRSKSRELRVECGTDGRVIWSVDSRRAADQVFRVRLHGSMTALNTGKRLDRCVSEGILAHAAG
jgi:hypothetical protein